MKWNSSLLKVGLVAVAVGAGAACSHTRGEDAPSFAQLDVNQDGVLSRDEINEKSPDVAFDRIDADHDGWVTSLEYGGYIDGTLSGATGGAGQQPDATGDMEAK